MPAEQKPRCVCRIRMLEAKKKRGWKSHRPKIPRQKPRRDKPIRCDLLKCGIKFECKSETTWYRVIGEMKDLENCDLQVVYPQQFVATCNFAKKAEEEGDVKYVNHIEPENWLRHDGFYEKYYDLAPYSQKSFGQKPLCEGISRRRIIRKKQTIYKLPHQEKEDESYKNWKLIATKFSYCSEGPWAYRNERLSKLVYTTGKEHLHEYVSCELFLMSFQAPCPLSCSITFLPRSPQRLRWQR